MQRTPVTSSNLDSVGYDAENEILEVAFRSGGVYRYFSVPQHVYDGLMSSGSKGQYFHRNIKGQYSWE